MFIRSRSDKVTEGRAAGDTAVECDRIYELKH